MRNGAPALALVEGQSGEDNHTLGVARDGGRGKMEKRIYEEPGYRLEAREGEDQEIEMLLIGKAGRKEFQLQEPAELPKPISSDMRRKGLDPAGYFWAGYPLRVSSREFVEGLWAEANDAEAAADSLRSQQEAAIEGLAELRAAVADHARYRREFEQMMSDELNDGANPPAGPHGDIATLAAKYPAAALYLKAESYELAHHWAKAKAGTEAMEIILAGGDLATAAAKLDNWLEDNDIEVD